MSGTKIPFLILQTFSALCPTAYADPGYRHGNKRSVHHSTASD
jgi:hypothetical protein